MMFALMVGLMQIGLITIISELCENISMLIAVEKSKTPT